MNQERIKLNAQSKKIQTQINTLKQEETGLEKELEANKENLEKIEVDIIFTGRLIADLQKLSIDRIKTAYIQRSNFRAWNLLLKEDKVSVAQSAYLLSKIRNYDLGVIKNYNELIIKLENEKEYVNVLAEKQSRLLLLIKENNVLLKERMEAQKKLTSQIAAKQKIAEKAVAELKTQAIRLENLVASMTGAEVEIDNKSKSKKSVSAISKAGTIDYYKGPGLRFAKLGGSPYPINGTIIKKTGKANNFQELMFDKGIEFASSPNADIEAIGEARVIHVGFMPGYGTVIILDHGQRYYSLYARITDVKVEAGDIVKKGEKIAQSSQPNNRGATLYFEIRKNGKAINPILYLKKG